MCRANWRIPAAFPLIVLLSCSTFASSITAETHLNTASVRADGNTSENIKRTALGDFIDENKGFPKTLTELRGAMDRIYGSSLSVVIPFSGAPGYTDLDEARTVYFSPAGDLSFRSN